MKLVKLIADSQGAETAQAYEAFQPNAEQLSILRRVGEEAISIFGSISHACVPMSAAYCARLEFELKKAVPVLMVAGSLKAGSEWVYGDGGTIDGKGVFSGSDPSWDGHAWLMFGPYVADASLLRTASSGRSHKSLEVTVRKQFGAERGPLILKWAEAPSKGLYFAPRYVLTDQEVTNSFLGAQRLLGII